MSLSDDTDSIGGGVSSLQITMIYIDPDTSVNNEHAMPTYKSFSNAT